MREGRRSDGGNEGGSMEGREGRRMRDRRKGRIERGRRWVWKKGEGRIRKKENVAREREK